MDSRAVVTVGTFDGVHKGHQAILRFLTDRAAERKAPAVLVTFDPHPREVVSGHPVPLLTTAHERAALVSELGVQETVILPFNREMAAMPAAQFVEEILVNRVGAGCVVIGYDHRFGAGRSGDRHLLEELGPKLGFDTEVIPAQEVGATVVSSSEIRRALSAGNVSRATDLMGRPYRWRGLVVEGDRRGRTIGYPTANLDPVSDRKIIPASGVYAVTVELPDGTGTGGMMNIGTRPTFDGLSRRQEVHLFDLDRDLYGDVLSVEFRERLRDERRFDGVEALIGQLKEDERRCRSLLEGVL